MCKFKKGDRVVVVEDFGYDGKSFKKGDTGVCWRDSGFYLLQVNWGEDIGGWGDNDSCWGVPQKHLSLAPTSYIMLDGKCIELSESSIASLREQFAPEEPKPIRLPVVVGEMDSDGEIEVSIGGNSEAISIFTKNILMNSSSDAGREISGYGSYGHLDNSEGTWYDKDGNEISGYLFYKPNK